MKFNTRMLTTTALLLALALAVQQFKIQWLTGPGVNAILVLATGYLGALSGIIIGIFTPLVALIMGIMPFAPAIPFIMLGNALLCIGYTWGKKINPLVGVVTGAILKFILLSLAVRYIIAAPPPVAAALSFPQLVTALTGGLIAIIILRYLPRNN